MRITLSLYLLVVLIKLLNIREEIKDSYLILNLTFTIIAISDFNSSGRDYYGLGVLFKGFIFHRIHDAQKNVPYSEKNNLTTRDILSGIPGRVSYYVNFNYVNLKHFQLVSSIIILYYVFVGILNYFRTE